VDPQARLSRRRPVVPLLFALLGAFIAIAAGLLLTRSHAPTPPPPDAAGLRARLTEMRGAIATYRTRHGHGPVTLQDLVADKLLREVPVDPITGSRATWRLVTEESVAIQDDFRSTTGGSERKVWIIDVHSGAGGAWSTY
jgi:hypothetical protein